MEPNQVESVVCVGLHPARIVGEVKMPTSSTGVWCVYDKPRELLLVVEHEWNWIALIDFGKSGQGESKATEKP
jgi:hypothetical protein